MSDDNPRRRRRPAPGGPRRSSGGGNSFVAWLVTIVAAIGVIVGGWFLGQTLAHVFNGSQNSQVAQQQPTTVPATPLPSPTEAGATPAASPTTMPSATVAPSAKPTAQPSKKIAAVPSLPPTAAPTIAPTEAPAFPPTPAVTVAPAATAEVRKTQPIARRLESPAPVTAAPVEEDAASRTVRAYIDALRHGDPSSAASYLGNGVPDETFIDGNTRIASINSSKNSDGSYKVQVDMKTTQGDYSETFVVASTPNGNRILEKSATQP